MAETQTFEFIADGSGVVRLRLTLNEPLDVPEPTPEFEEEPRADGWTRRRKPQPQVED